MKIIKYDQYLELKFTPTEDLELLENHINIKFPENYRKFVIENGWCKVKPDGFYIGFMDDKEKNIKPEELVSTFHGLDVPEDEACNLLWNFNCFYARARVPEDLLPIASTLGGQILLGIKGINLGKIYYWPQDFELEREGYDNCTLLANSLEDFLESLR